MKHIIPLRKHGFIYGLSAMLLPFMVSCSDASQQTGRDAPRVVVIGVDGMSPDGIRHADTPHLDTLMAGGAYSFKARAVLTTSSSQNWSSMIMGAGPVQHGITSNAWQPDHFSIEPTAAGSGPIFPAVFDLFAPANALGSERLDL